MKQLVSCVASRARPVRRSVSFRSVSCRVVLCRAACRVVSADGRSRLPGASSRAALRRADDTPGRLFSAAAADVF